MRLDILFFQTAGCSLRSVLHVRSAPVPGAVLAEPAAAAAADGHAHDHISETMVDHAALAAEHGTLDLRISAIFGEGRTPSVSVSIHIHAASMLLRQAHACMHAASKGRASSDWLQMKDLQK
jgi:hypothetical protein